jgi:hypothetical protein
MKETLENYLVKQPNVTFFFITFRDQESHIVMDETAHIIYVKGTDSIIPGILNKTMLCLRYCVDQNIPFQYFVRSNISTILQFSKFPYEEMLMRANGHASTHVNNFDPAFASGTNIILNREMTNYLLDHQHELNYSEHDDVTIGKIIGRCTPPYQLENKMSWQPHTSLDHFAYRHKSEDRYRDADDMKSLCQSL